MVNEPLARALIAPVVAVALTVLLLPAAALAVAQWLFTAAVRVVARCLEPAFVDWTELIQFDPALGWKPRPGLRGHYLALNDDVFHLETDGEGWPGTRPLDSSEVVVIGDSFAFGYGVDTHRSFAALKPALRIKAVGSPGYSMVHGVRLMEQFGLRLRGKLVVWFAFLENDLQDNLAPEMHGYRAPFARFNRAHQRWEIVDRHLSAEKWELSKLDTRRLYPAFCVPGPLADRAYAVSDFLVERAQRACREAGAHLVLVSIPHPMQLTPSGRAAMAALSGNAALCDPDLPDRRISESCRRHAVPLVIGKAHLSPRDYKTREGIHWNEQGHRRVAALLEDLYAAFRSGALMRLVPGHARADSGFSPRRAADASAAPSPAAGGRPASV